MLFISKEVVKPAFLEYVKAAEINLTDIPMISFVEVPFECPQEEYEVVFFTSPRSAKFYLNRCKLSSEIDIATIGKSTSKFVESKGYHPKFTGVTSGVPALVSEEFKEFVNGRKVLFPQSNYSHRSMQNRLVEHQITDLVVYKTALIPVELQEEPKVLVFTSPTNVESFLQLNSIKKHQKVIAWGKTTEGFLAQKGVQSDHTLRYSSFEELKEVLEENYYSVEEKRKF